MALCQRQLKKLNAHHESACKKVLSRYYQADALQIVKKDAKRAFPTKQIGDIDFYKSEQNFV